MTLQTDQGGSVRPQSISPVYLMLFLTSALAFFTAHPDPCIGQVGQPRVVTTESRVQFEGEVFSVPEISESALLNPAAEKRAFVVVDDGLRRVFLKYSTVLQNFGDSNRGNEIAFDIHQRDFGGGESGGSFVGVGPFDEFGHRTFTIGVRTAKGTPIRRTYVQGITKITPRYCILKTLANNDTAPLKQWTMHISTGTVPKDVLRNVLLSHVKNPNNANEFFDIAYLFQQMGDFAQASEELRQLETNPNFPNLKERIRDARDQLGQLKARQILREIRLRMDSGQNQLALQLAQVTNKERLAGEILAEFQDIEEQALESQNELDAQRRQVFDLIANIANINADQVPVVERFKQELESDLNEVNAPRLAAYALQANDASMPDQQKLSLAISGWFLGSNNAIPNLAVSQWMFSVRDLVTEYLTEGTTPLRRSQILKELATFEAGAPKYLNDMIKQMKPVDAPPEIETYTGKKPIEFSIEVPGTLANPEPKQYRCLAHLPPQYNPYRNYPLILSLPGGSQSAEQNLAMWCGNHNEKLNIRQGHAMRNGYIVVTVDWRDPGQVNWGYTGREHRVVIDGLYHSMRKFSIDSDRVFLSGHRTGGDGAYDIGVSHPEHWAGVIGFSGKFGKFIDKYWDNTHIPLPFYCVIGQRDFATLAEMKFALNKWVRDKFINPTVVQYLGRGNELFLEELPETFKWMRGQKRRWPDRNGFAFECSALRPWDTYYWFYEMHGIPADRIVAPELFDKTKKFNKLTISGETKELNVFKLGPQSLRIAQNSTLWLSPEFADLNERIEIKGRGSFKGFVKPSRKVILDDVLRRADREHIYWARIDNETGRGWIIK